MNPKAATAILSVMAQTESKNTERDNALNAAADLSAGVNKPAGCADEISTGAIENRMRRIKRQKNRKAVLIRVITAALIIYLLFGVLFGIAVVQGDSMEPAVQEGDAALFLRTVYEYKAGDIVLLKTEDGMKSVKRIVAVSGQTVDIDDSTGVLIVDGEKLFEPYIYNPTYSKEGVQYPLTLGEGEYFVLGDYRENSHDSRNYGAVTRAELCGKFLVLFRRPS